MGRRGLRGHRLGNQQLPTAVATAVGTGSGEILLVTLPSSASPGHRTTGGFVPNPGPDGRLHGSVDLRPVGRHPARAASRESIAVAYTSMALIALVFRRSEFAGMSERSGYLVLPVDASPSSAPPLDRRVGGSPTPQRHPSRGDRENRGGDIQRRPRSRMPDHAPAAPVHRQHVQGLRGSRCKRTRFWGAIGQEALPQRCGLRGEAVRCR